MALALEIYAALATLGPCYKCGIEFAAPASYVKKRREDKAEFYCPNGHPQCYGKGPVQILEEQLAAEKSRREWAEKGRDRAQHAEAIASGKLKALKQRVKNGVCPCCQRSFENLQRHMKTKHPEFDETCSSS